MSETKGMSELVALWSPGKTDAQERPVLGKTTIEKPAQPGGLWRYTITVQLNGTLRRFTGKGEDVAAAREDAFEQAEHAFVALEIDAG